MKRLIAVAALGLSLALPNVSEAHGFFHGGHGGSGYRGGGYGYRGGGGGYGYRGGYGHGGGLFGLLALPFVAGAAIVGAAATVATAPFAGGYAPPAPAYYGPPAPAYYAPPAGYYPQQTYAPGYYGPQQGYYPPAYPGYYRGY